MPVRLLKREEVSPEYEDALRYLDEIMADFKAGEGGELFDNWNEIDPGFLNRCSIPSKRDDDNLEDGPELVEEDDLKDES